MGVKFIVGLTNEDSSCFYKTYNLPPGYVQSLNFFDYILLRNDTVVEKATIEWELDTTLPAVNNLINIISQIKLKPDVTNIIYTRYQDYLPGYAESDFLIKMYNLIPNNDINFPEYTITDYENITTNSCPTYGSLTLDTILSQVAHGVEEHQTLSYAMHNTDVSLLTSGPTKHVVFPALRINFLSNSNPVAKKEMSMDQKFWMTENKEILESKGFYISDIRNKIGRLVIGRLIGSYDDVFTKAQTYNKICRIEIVEE